MKDLGLGRGQYRLACRNTADMAIEPSDTGGFIALGAFTVEVGQGVHVASVEAADVQATILGTVVDYAHPGRPIREALADTATALATGGPACVAAATRFLGGRWLLLWQARGTTHAFLDPTGMMRLFYMGSGDALAAGSDPRLIRDDDSFRVPAAAYATRMAGEYWWPGPISPMPGLSQLLPNHYLRLDDGTAIRCWPTGAYPELSLAEATSRCAELLQNGIAGLRTLPQGLCMGLTAGLDTRVLLAASREFAAECEFFTFRYASLSASHPDLVVAKMLARKFGLRYLVIDTAATMSAGFAESYQARVMQAHADWGPLAEAMHHSPLAKRLLLKGCPGGETFTEYFGACPDESASPAVLRELAQLPDVGCVNDSVAEWYAAALAWQDRDPGIRIGELFYWEQRNGCWQAMSQEEYGLAQETFSPFNCRAVYEIALAVRREHRQRVNSSLQTELVRAMWPELLRVPVNPDDISRRARARQRLKKALPRGYAGYARIRRRRES